MSWLTSLAITAVMMIEPMTLDEESNFRCDGNAYGLKNAQEQMILPEKYAKIEHMGHGIYLAIEPNKSNQFEYGEGARHVFNRTGKELDVKYPDCGTFLRIYWFGKKADADPGLMLDSLPVESIIKYREGNKTGLCDTSGNTIFLAERGLIEMPRDGLGVVAIRAEANSSKYRKVRIFDCAKKELAVRPIKTKFRMNSGPDYPEVTDVNITFKKWDDGKFNSEYWKKKVMYPISREDMFKRFVRDNKIVGMTKEELERNLGPANETTITGAVLFEMSPYFCSPEMQMVIVFHLKDNKVERWFISERGSLKK
ncbi:hypothetical protein KA183_17360 [bacterium]|nr:hypothetical protein [bacterium]QQR57807.1 MAG: hypothetical protein IPG59_23020 [Candidatus Melainabacteria bacterium]